MLLTFPKKRCTYYEVLTFKIIEARGQHMQMGHAERLLRLPLWWGASCPIICARSVRPRRLESAIHCKFQHIGFLLGGGGAGGGGGGGGGFITINSPIVILIHAIATHFTVENRCIFLPKLSSLTTSTVLLWLALLLLLLLLLILLTKRLQTHELRQVSRLSHRPQDCSPSGGFGIWGAFCG